MTNSREPIRAPHGTELSCRGWPQEAALRMLMNNLDPDVAERPEDLVVYGGSGRAARSWEAFDAIVAELRDLRGDETLLIQSGKPVGRFRTHERAPRVLISNSMLVPKWATFEEFHRLEGMGLTMYGQMTAGSWIYIGSQGILQGTYETLAELAVQNFDGTLAGRIVLTAGLGGMGGAQPLAITMNGGVALCVEVDPARIEKRMQTRYLDRCTTDLDEAVEWAEAARDEGRAESIGLLGNAAETHPRLLEMGFFPDVVTDQTSAHDMLEGYVPAGMTLEEAEALRTEDAEAYMKHSFESVATPRRGVARVRQEGLDLRRVRQCDPSPGREGRGDRGIRYPGLRRGVRPPAVLRGQGPVQVGRAVRRPGRHPRHRRDDPRTLPRRRSPPPLDPHGSREGRVPGPPRTDLLARLRRTGEGGPGVQRAGRLRAASRHRSSSDATTSMLDPSRRRTARPRA